MVGAESCKQGSAFFVSPWGGGAGNYSQGCEQVQAIASAIDVSQRVFNCTLKSLSRTESNYSTTTHRVDVTIGDNFKANNCSINIEKKTGISIIRYSQMSDTIKEAMNSQLDTTMETIAKTLQEDKKTGVFQNAEGQKAIANFTQAVNNAVTNQSLTSVVSSIMSKYETDSTLVFTLGNGAVFGFTNPVPGQYCINIKDEQVVELVSQTIVNTAIDIVMKNDLSSDLKTLLENSQKRTTEGLTLPNIGMFVVIGVVILIVVAMMFLKRPGGGGMGYNTRPPPLLAGAAAKLFSIIIMVVGLITMIAGIVLLLLKKSLLLSVGLIVGGALIAIAGFVFFLKTKAQQTLFEQQLRVAEASAGRRQDTTTVV